MRLNILSILLYISAITLVGCGAGGGSSSETVPATTVTGSFIDDPVQGLTYICSTSAKSGTTNTEGEYTCVLGSDVTFMLGDVTLGTVSAKNGIVTPYDLFPNNEEAAINVARLLQTLDSDPNDDIITFSNELIELLPSDIDFENFSDDYVETALGTVLVDKETAQETLNTAIATHTGNAPNINKAPIANAGTDKTVTVDQSISITGSGSDSDGNIVGYEWKKGSEVLASTAAFIYTPTSVGTDILTLTVTDNDGATGSDSMNVNVVENQAPTANAGTDKTVKVDQSISITGSGSDSDGNIVGYEWKKGSEVLASTAAFIYTPTSVGTDILTLTVTDNDGATGSDSMNVNVVENQAPTANAGTDKTATVDQSISITGSGSDSDGNIVGYEWKKGSEVLASTAAFIYTPTSVGTDILTLTVTDNDGATGSDTMNVTVTTVPVNQAPKANAGTDKTATVDQSISITGSGSDSDGNIVGYEWKKGSEVLASTAAFIYTPTSVGTDILTLTVTDNDGATGSDSMNVNVVENQAPTANAGTDKTVKVDQSISITGSGSDSDGNIVGYEWKKGSEVLASTAAFIYTPTSVGTDILTLTVTDNDGATGSDSMNVNVVENQAPTANAGTDKTATVDQSISITGSGSDSDGNIVGYEWKKGSEVLASTAAFIYTPTSVGTDILTLTVTDNDGATGSDTMNVDVTASDQTSIIITESYQVESLGSESIINTTVSLSTPKSLYLVLSNNANTPSSVTLTHDAKVFEESTTQKMSLMNTDDKPNIQHAPKHIVDFNSQSKELLLSIKDENLQAKSLVIAERQEDVLGTSKIFYFDQDTAGDSTIATNRRITSNGTITLNIWVSDDSFELSPGLGCGRVKCITQDMVNILADTFLKNNSNNDIYNWVTNIYGEEWGSVPSNLDRFYIEDNNQITILLTDINHDNSTNGGVLGYFYSKDNIKNDYVSGSNERIMFYIDSVLFANGSGTWDIDDFWPKEMISTLAHEFQHMINYYQKTILLDTDLDTWISEMLSESTEDLVATKIQHSGPRGVVYTDGSAGSPGNTKGRYPDFNENNTLSLTSWNNQIEDYSKVSAFGAYLLRNYGGAKLLHDIMHNNFENEQAVVDAVNKSEGVSGKTFANLLSEWGVAVMLSDHDNLVDTPEYNTGWFTESVYGSIAYDMGSINFFNYSPLPRIYTTVDTVQPQGNYYYKIGDNLTGDVTIDLQLNGQTEVTLIAK